MSTRLRPATLLACLCALSLPAIAKNPSRQAAPQKAGRFSLQQIQLSRQRAPAPRLAKPPRSLLQRPAPIAPAEVQAIAVHVAAQLGSSSAVVDSSRAFHVSAAQPTSSVAHAALGFSSSASFDPGELIVDSRSDSGVWIHFDTNAGYYYLLDCGVQGSPDAAGFSYFFNPDDSDFSTSLTGDAMPQQGHLIIPLQPGRTGRSRVMLTVRSSGGANVAYVVHGCLVTPARAG